jgi:hypothetical protein
MPGRFILKSYQLSENMKWIPAADLIEYGSNSSSCEVKDEFQIRDHEFETKDEADKFISDILIKRGYTKG